MGKNKLERKREKVLIFGLDSDWIAKETALRRDFEILAIIDESSENIGKQYDEIRIISPQEITGYAYDTILITVYGNIAAKIEACITAGGDPAAIRLCYPKGCNVWKKQVIEEENKRLIANFDRVRFYLFHGTDFYILEEIFLRNCYGFLSNIDKEAIVIDIGMNVGYASLFFASQDFVKKVYAYEPFRDTYIDALENFSINDTEIREKIVPHNFALSNYNGEMELHFDRTQPGDMNILEDNIHLDGAKTTVLVKRASEMLKDILQKNQDKMIIVKMDTEGSEYDIAEDLEKADLFRYVDVLLGETHFDHEQELLDRLQRSGFFCFSPYHGHGNGMVYAVRYRSRKGLRENGCSFEERSGLEKGVYNRQNFFEKKPKISIVLPVYNGERYLRESLDSILAQTMTDFELIAVDDCSTDATSVILAEYAVRDSRIRIIRNGENQKLPRSLNIGFAEARGEYLTWTSDDNVYLPEAFVRMADYLDRFPDTMMVNASVDMMDEEGNVEHSEGDRFDAEFLLSFYENRIGACFLYRRTVLEEIGGYDPEMFLIEDHEYWLRIMLQYGRIGHIKEVLYHYRQHAKSLTATRKNEVIKQAFKARRKHLRGILSHVIEYRALAVLLFCHGFATNEWREEDKAIFYEYLPELRRIAFLTGQKPLVVYAGDEQYARLAVQQNGGNVSFIAVKDKPEQDEQWAGVPLIAGEELMKRKDAYEVTVASSVADLYAALEDLGRWGVEMCGIVLA